MSKSKNQHRREIDWKVGDHVWLSTKNLQSDRPSKKLSALRTGPYLILEQVGNSYRLELSPGSRIHDIFAPNVLSKASEDPLPGQERPKPGGIAITGQEDEYEVDQILAVRLYRRKLQYRVSWIGHDPDPI